MSNRDTLNFLNKRISTPGGLIIILVALLVGGILIWREGGIEGVLMPAAVQILPPASNELADWQIYRNDDYGFELKYPSEWEFLVNDPYGKKNPSFRDKKYDGSFEWPGLDIDWPPIYGLEIPEIESKIFKLEGAENDLITISFTEGSKRIVATCKIYLDSNVIKICNKIISTFQFLK